MATDGIRITDEERDRVAARLREAVGQGALQLGEVEERLETVYRARTREELDAVVSDLPQASPEPVKPSALAGFRSVSFRSHLTMYVLVNAVLVGIWMLGPQRSAAGPFVIAGIWAMALVRHYMEATQRINSRAQRHGRDRELRGRSPQSGSQRRFVVAMFADIAESTRLNEAMGDEAWAAERERFRQLAAQCFKREGGWEVSASGDGILARFDEPCAGVRAAIALQQKLARTREGHFAPSVRIGLHSGYAIDEGDDIVGAVVNLASRVCEVSDPGEILITEHVADHLDGRIETTGRGLQALKGVAQPRHILAVKW